MKTYTIKQLTVLLAVLLAILMVPFLIAICIREWDYRTEYIFEDQIDTFAQEYLEEDALICLGKSSMGNHTITWWQADSEIHSLTFEKVRDKYRIYDDSTPIQNGDGIYTQYFYTYCSILITTPDCEAITYIADANKYKISVNAVPFVYSLNEAPQQLTFHSADAAEPAPPIENNTASATETQAVIDTTTAERPSAEIPDGEYVYLYLQEDAGWECTAEIPHINISPELDAMVNADIDRLFTARIPDARNGAFGSYRVQYEYSVMDGIFSLLVYSGEGTDVGSPVYPYTVTIDLETQTILSLHTVMDKYGFDYITVMEEIDTLSTFWSPGTVDTDSPDSEYFDMQMYDFAGGMFYIDSEGHVNLVGKVHYTHLGDHRDFETVRYTLLYDLHEKNTIALM